MDTVEEIYRKTGDVDSQWRKMIKNHSNVVKEISLELTKRYEENHQVELNKELMSMGAMVHDIGLLVDKINKSIVHGEVGYKWMIENKYPEDLARFCLVHVGVGFDTEEALEKPFDQKLNHLPMTIEEEIVTYADNFTSKDEDKLYWNDEGYVDKKIVKYGEKQFNRWLSWKLKYGLPDDEKIKKIIFQYNRQNEKK